MSLLQMSFSGGVMVLLLVLVRGLFRHKVPKTVFPALWAIVMLRLLLPFSLQSAYSAYSVMEQNVPALQEASRAAAWNFEPLCQLTMI